MRVLIIEDESAAARRLAKLIQEVEPAAEIIGQLDSVESAVKWHEQNNAPDLYFLDIQLADGLSFELVSQLQIKQPIIFTTAYDEYAVKAFKVNSIDYLLKPIDKLELSDAIQKYKSSLSTKPSELHALVNELLAARKQYRERFLVRKGDSFVPLLADEIAYFYAEEKVVFAKSKQNQRYLIEFTLDQLESSLNPSLFYRANRQFMLALDAVKRVSNHFNGKLKVIVEPGFEEEILISREKASAFKSWLGKA